LTVALKLLLSVLLDMSRRRMFGALSSMNGMRACQMSMVRGFFMVSGFVMLRCFPVMPRRACVVFGCILRMFGCFLGQAHSPYSYVQSKKVTAFRVAFMSMIMYFFQTGSLH
jgi:hypothetical protein